MKRKDKKNGLKKKKEEMTTLWAWLPATLTGLSTASMTGPPLMTTLNIVA